MTTSIARGKTVVKGGRKFDCIKEQNIGLNKEGSGGFWREERSTQNSAQECKIGSTNTRRIGTFKKKLF